MGTASPAASRKSELEKERVEKLRARAMYSLWGLIIYIVFLFGVYGLAVERRRKEGTMGKGRKQGALTKSVWGDMGVIAASSAGFYGVTIGSMYLNDYIQDLAKYAKHKKE